MVTQMRRARKQFFRHPVYVIPCNKRTGFTMALVKEKQNSGSGLGFDGNAVEPYVDAQDQHGKVVGVAVYGVQPQEPPHLL